MIVTWFQALLQGELVNRGGCVGVANNSYFTVLAWPAYFLVDSNATGIRIVKLPYMDNEGTRVWIEIEGWAQEEWRIDFGQTVKLGGGFVKFDSLNEATRRSIPEHCKTDEIWLVSPEIELPTSRRSP
ncbi:MAG: hypothetical protein NZM11_03275 [Anaerolineales bacterium]|nr:hypothetical protein [Anaerolineales bacterium]